jgi:hypothetical protein
MCRVCSLFLDKKAVQTKLDISLKCWFIMFYGTFPNGVIFFIQIYVFQYFTSVMIV